MQPLSCSAAHGEIDLWVQRPDGDRSGKKKAAVHPSRVESLLSANGVVWKAEPPRSGSGERCRERPEEPSVPLKADQGKQEQNGSCEADRGRFAHPRIRCPRHEEMREGGEQEQAGDAIGEHGFCHGFPLYFVIPMQFVPLRSMDFADGFVV